MLNGFFWEQIIQVKSVMEVAVQPLQLITFFLALKEGGAKAT